eukprot:1115515-Prymnesium_polylepis.2
MAVAGGARGKHSTRSSDFHCRISHRSSARWLASRKSYPRRLSQNPHCNCSRPRSTAMRTQRQVCEHYASELLRS